VVVITPMIRFPVLMRFSRTCYQSDFASEILEEEVINSIVLL
jgi:hypothetical protein